MKYTRITRLSIVAVLIIFLLQALLVYRLFQSSVDLLQRELNYITQSVSNIELNMRLSSNMNAGLPNVKYNGTKPPAGVDTSKIKTVKLNGSSLNKTEGLVSTLALAMNEFVEKSRPINLGRIDSLANIQFKENNINLSFYSEVVDLTENKVLMTSLKDSMSLNILNSKDIYLNTAQTKALRITLIDPMSKIYTQMAWVLILALLLSVFCIYSLYMQMKTLSKQKKLATVKNDFFSEISHEFKRPLAVLLQAVESLRNDRIVANQEKRLRMLKIAESEIEKMTSKTEMLLSLAQEDEGLFNLHLTELDFAKLVFDFADNVVDLVSGSPEIDIYNELRNPIIVGDKTHLEQMVSNLIGNAIKYSKEDNVEINVKMYQEDDNICLSIKDKGVGIAPENLDVIFEKYSRVGDSSHAKGHGIGLNYVKRIVEKHGGTISVTSQLNIGSEFIVKLPVDHNLK